MVDEDGLIPTHVEDFQIQIPLFCSHPFQPDLHSLLRHRLHQRDVVLAASLERLPQVLGHRHDESSGMAPYRENYNFPKG